MKILMTGGTGFTGRRLIKRLSADPQYEIDMLVRPKSRFPEDLAGLSRVRACPMESSLAGITRTLEQIRPDLVIHLASRFVSEHDPDDVEELIQSNIAFPAFLFEAMRLAGMTRIITAGTSWQNFEGSPAYDPVNLYAATKQSCEDLLLYYVRRWKWKALNLKLFDTYGEHDPRPKLLPALIRTARNGGELHLSAGEQELDLLHVEDVVEAFVSAISFLNTSVDEGRLESFFLGSGEKHSLRNVVKIFEEVSGLNVNACWGSRPYRAREVMTLNFDVNRTMNALGWRPKFSLKEGLRHVLEQESVYD